MLSSAALLAMTTQAEAAGATVGAVMTSVTTALGSFPNLLSAVAYLLGLLYSIQGVFMFKDHVDGGSGMVRAPVPLSAGVKRFIAGGMLLSAPFMSSAAYNSLAGNGLAQIQAGTNHGAPAGPGPDAMIVGFISNISGPASFLLMAFAYISAIILLITGITRLTHTAQEGPRGPTGLGTMMTFLASGGLFAIGGMMGTFCNSFFGKATTSTFAMIGTNILSNPADVAIVAPVIESVMTFIMIVGFIAFIRGWFVLKAFADGNSQTSVAQAITFLIGGTLAINLGQLVNVIEGTLGLSAANSITFQ